LVLVHFLKDIAPSDEFTINVELRIGGPIAVNFTLLADNGIIENIDTFEVSQTCIVEEVPYFLRSSTTKLEYPHLG